jgi:hypothetical protein
MISTRSWRRFVTGSTPAQTHAKGTAGQLVDTASLAR